MVLSSGKDALGDGRKLGSRWSFWDLWHSTFLQALRDCKINTTNEEKYRKGKTQHFDSPRVIAMNERNTETQRITETMVFINLSVLPHPETMSNSKLPCTTMTKPEKQTERGIIPGLEGECHPYRKRLK